MLDISKKEVKLNGFALRIIAVISMIAGFAGYELGYRFEWLEAFGWTSFTLFAFLLTEGCAHTSDKMLYIRRFIVFGLLSEFIFDLFMTGRTWFNSTRYLVFRDQSVMVSLFAGLMLMMLLQYIKARYDNLVVNMICFGVLGYALCRFAEIYHFQFGRYGIIIILMFYLARSVSYPKLLELAVLFYICFFLTSDVLTVISIGRLQYPLSPQLYSFIAMPFIWSYSGNRGPNSIPLQVAQYLAYPVIMVVFIILRHI